MRERNRFFFLSKNGKGKRGSFKKRHLNLKEEEIRRQESAIRQHARKSWEIDRLTARARWILSELDPSQW